ncbi:putative T6SS immunity periplasmic lipoprotein [Erwinia sp. HDF1-3R]|uniref:putative T6SS immunity periplasmic lipoprotein n=1 Tax=Erwinia sp. HDF1-3R TaxID=3141543 RepID=UPI0031F525A5
MEIMMIYKSKRCSILLIASIFFLTGCPGSGDRLTADETTTVSQTREDVCFVVSNAANYQPSLISINPRGTPPQKLSVTDSPDLRVKNGRLCIQPNFYRFTDKAQYVVQYILEAPGGLPQRSVVTGIEFSQGQVKSIPLKDSEITRGSTH